MHIAVLIAQHSKHVVYLEGVMGVRSFPMVWITLRPHTQSPVQMPTPPYRSSQIGVGELDMTEPLSYRSHRAMSGPIALLMKKKENKYRILQRLQSAPQYKPHRHKSTTILDKYIYTTHWSINCRLFRIHTELYYNVITYYHQRSRIWFRCVTTISLLIGEFEQR